MIFYIIEFILLLLISAFFSSAEASFLSVNKIKLSAKVRRRDKKAILLWKILEKPSDLISTILIGSNFINIAAASISTAVFTRLIVNNEELSLLVSTLVTSTVILFFTDILPKYHAYSHSEKLAYIYVYPVRFLKRFFYPLVKVSASITNLISKKKSIDEKNFTIDEIKHFLATEVKDFQYNPEVLLMVHEIIDIIEKDIKAIMTPRLNMVVIDEKSGFAELRRLIIEKRMTDIPVFRNNLDNIIGIIHDEDLLAAMMLKPYEELDLQKIMRPPVFVSEYSSLNYVLKEFRKHDLEIAVVVDEYGSTIGLVTLNDMFKEILGNIKWGYTPIQKAGRNSFILQGNISVEEVNRQLILELPLKSDYQTISGFFIYHFGKFPKEGNAVRVKNVRLVVQKMGKRKIDEVQLTREESKNQ
ncbi:MAG: hemolysin family protein [Candidatus Omnitrophota bacterium]